MCFHTTVKLVEAFRLFLVPAVERETANIIFRFEEIGHRMSEHDDFQSKRSGEVESINVLGSSFVILPCLVSVVTNKWKGRNKSIYCTKLNTSELIYFSSLCDTMSRSMKEIKHMIFMLIMLFMKQGISKTFRNVQWPPWLNRLNTALLLRTDYDNLKGRIGKEPTRKSEKLRTHRIKERVQKRTLHFDGVRLLIKTVAKNTETTGFECQWSERHR